MEITAQQRFKVRKFVKELENFRGRHTELVTVYVPQGYDLNKIIQHLAQEQGTATNIKSTSTRKNVIDALERMIQHLKVVGRTPPNGLAVFSGNVAEREGQSDVQVWSIDPPLPIKMRLYRCDKEFVLDILRDMYVEKNSYGLVVLDRRDAEIALLKGKAIVPVLRTHSEVPGKFRAGGQCLIKGTIVQASDGTLCPIENILPGMDVKAMYEDKIENAEIIDKWSVKKSEVYTITTKTPQFRISASKDHLFFVLTPEEIIEKPAEFLRKGDLLLMPEKIDVNTERFQLNTNRYYNSFILNKAGCNLLRQQRLNRGIHQSDLAIKNKITQTTISSYEIGKINPKTAQLQSVCGSLNIDFDDFLDFYTVPVLNADIKLPDILDVHLAQFIGYLISDGCMETDMVTFFEQDKQVSEAYKILFDAYFQMNSSSKFRKTKNYHQLRFTSRPLVRMIKGEFPEVKKATNSQIPEKILQSPDKVLAGFLRGFFDAEGYVNLSRGIGLGIHNKLLAQEIQLSLLRFSIISSIHEYDNRANKYSDKPRFSIDITEKESLELFNKLIGFTGQAKSQKLIQIIDKKSNTSHVRQILIPGKKIKYLIESKGISFRLFPKVSNFFQNKRMMSKKTFNSPILANIADNELRNKLSELSNCSIMPVKISSIETQKKQVEMIDISTTNQSFIANGLIVHNSAARFSRLREEAAKQHYKKVADHMKEQFLPLIHDLKGIIIGGPSTTTNDFLGKEYLTGEIAKKIIGVKDLSYTGTFGLNELVDKSQDLLADEEIASEKEAMGNFFKLLSTQEGKVAYGLKDVEELLNQGAVETLLVSETLDDDKIEFFDEESKKVGSEMLIISTETREGVQLRDIGKVAAILRYDVSH